MIANKPNCVGLSERGIRIVPGAVDGVVPGAVEKPPSSSDRTAWHVQSCKQNKTATVGSAREALP